jgi:peptidoglycan/LPS O-acetylase OafA/YrhL
MAVTVEGHAGVADPTAAPERNQLARVNNFDLIRAIAAMQVLVRHAIEHMHVERLQALGGIIDYLPGVPIFFVVSGFLITRSWERAPSAMHYAMNRVLRIYPALWICLGLSILIFLSAGVRPPSTGALLVWVLGQLSIVQFYNPPFLRNFGVGVLNGSLWTIAVELQFYLALPVLAYLARRQRWGWWPLTVAALTLMLVLRPLMLGRVTMTEKLIGVTVFPYLFFFLMGALAQQIFRTRSRWFVRTFVWWALTYVAWVVVERQFGVAGSGGNELNPVSIVLVAGLTISAAYTMPALSHRLHGNDISYGIYIYHMPVINLLLFHGIAGIGGLFATLVIVGALAILSWKIIEKPALGLKRYSARTT